MTKKPREKQGNGKETVPLQPWGTRPRGKSKHLGKSPARDKVDQAILKWKIGMTGKHKLKKEKTKLVWGQKLQKVERQLFPVTGPGGWQVRKKTHRQTNQGQKLEGVARKKGVDSDESSQGKKKREKEQCATRRNWARQKQRPGLNQESNLKAKAGKKEKIILVRQRGNLTRAAGTEQ